MSCVMKKTITMEIKMYQSKPFFDLFKTQFNILESFLINELSVLEDKRKAIKIGNILINNTAMKLSFWNDTILISYLIYLESYKGKDRDQFVYSIRCKIESRMDMNIYDKHLDNEQDFSIYNYKPLIICGNAKEASELLLSHLLVDNKMQFVPFESE